MTSFLMRAGVTGLALWLWTKGQVGAGAVAAAAAMALRLNGISHWIMWEMASLFEHIGTVQDGINTLARPQQVLDKPGAPPLQVAAAGSLSFTVKHRYDFETDATAMPPDYYDGARIELSDDGGTTWQDLGPKITMNGYTGTLLTLPPPSSNPLSGEQVFAGQSAGYTDMNGAPGYITSTVDLGTTYQGKTVQVRFRVGTDPATGAGGWDIDEIAFTGLAGTPFAGRQAHRAMCSAEKLTLNIGGAQRVPSGFLVQLGGSVAVSAGRPITYKWTQTAGPTVQLSSDTVTNPTFTAPTVSEATVISLQLLASDGVLESTATVDITVVPAQGPMTTATGCSYGGLPTTGGAAGAGGFAALALALAAVRRRRRS